MTRRLTAAQAVVEFLAHQHSERDGSSQRLVPGCFGILGHGNVAGLGQALQEREQREQHSASMPFYPARNEQGMVHAAAAYARASNRLRTLACTSSIGPGATNMITGAAAATVNRLPVLLLPGDIFATRGPAPVLQQLESGSSQDVSVNDCLAPVARYWDRINRPEQLIASLPAAMRVLTDPADTGAVVLAMPQDVQAEAYDFPEQLFADRVWRVPRPVPEPAALAEAGRVIASARRPLIVAGGGVIYSAATEELRALVDATGIPVGETHAGKGALPYGHPLVLGGVGASGTRAANEAAREADVVIGVGTRWTDFTTASHTAFAHPDVAFVNLNVASFDAGKHAGVPVVADARGGLAALAGALAAYSVPAGYREDMAGKVRAWDAEVDRLYQPQESSSVLTQAEVIGAINEVAGERPRRGQGGAERASVIVGASGSAPGDLHKLWRPADPKQYHVEYGYSCMGYEVAGGLGVKMAAPDRDVFVFVGDGSWLMLSQEIVTSVQEGVPIVVVLVENGGYASIGGLSKSVGSGGFGTRYRRRAGSGALDGEPLPVDLAANAASLGARVLRPPTRDELGKALEDARDSGETTVVHVRTDLDVGVDNHAWWDVPVAEVAESADVRSAREDYEERRRQQRPYL